MSDLQAAKATVQAHYKALAGASPDTVGDIIAAAVSPDYMWRGMHPFHEQSGAAAVAETFWAPFLTSMSRVQRREDIFFAGQNEMDGFTSVWTASMGHLMGLFDAPWLGIPPTGKMIFLRYAEFNKVEEGVITETALFCDILHLMMQAGLQPLPPQTAAHLVQPGPMTQDGLLYGPQEAGEGEATLALINRMIGDINTHQRFQTPQEELAECWHDDMIWWGPAGIGATYTIDRYIEQHQRPFRTQITDRVFNGHLCRMAEGTYGGFFGWPNLTLTNAGGYTGMTGSNTRADMRVVDIYRRDGDKLAENWIFIDMLHFLNMQGLDVLGRMASLGPPAKS